jgi:hypothetical protein
MGQANHGESSREVRSSMPENRVRVKTKRLSRISQGDIFTEIECIESVTEKRGIITVEKIVFPLVVVLSQDCDLEQDARYRIGMKTASSDDKRLLSVLVAPLYNAEHVFEGVHLSDLNMKMQVFSRKSSRTEALKQNEVPRYHYFEFPSEIPIVPQIADFKHFFSVNLNYLEAVRSKSFKCRISELFREDLSQRFASYLARIGLPDAISKNGKADQSASI